MLTYTLSTSGHISKIGLLKMGCNTSQEQATVSVEPADNAAKTVTENDMNADVDLKTERNETTVKDTSTEIPLVNGDPIGKDEGELFINSNPFFFH